MSSFEYGCKLDEVLFQVCRIHDCLSVLDDITEDLDAPISDGAKALIGLLKQAAASTIESVGVTINQFPPVG